MSNPIPQKKREDYIDWEEYFMAAAILSGQRSKDPSRQVGACIVNKEKRIVGLGYNGMPKDCHDDHFPWGKDTSELCNKHLYVCHAEMNAILNKNCADLKGCTIYIGLFPCNECAKMIIQSGISEVVYLSDEDTHNNEVYTASMIMLEIAGVKYRKFETKKKEIVINFGEFDSA